MYFPAFEEPSVEFYVAQYDAIEKSYFVQRLGKAPKWEDEKSLRRLLRSNNEHMVIPANELDANDPLLLEYSRYETSGGRARTAAKDAVKAIKINVEKLEQASDAEDDEQTEPEPTTPAKKARVRADEQTEPEATPVPQLDAFMTADPHVFNWRLAKSTRKRNDSC